MSYVPGEANIVLTVPEPERTHEDTLKKRLGLTITSEKDEDGVRRYRV